MKRSTHQGTSAVFAYGAQLIGPFDQESADILYRQNRLWNSLVEIHRAGRDRYAEILTEASSEVSRLTEAYNGIKQAIENAYADKRKANARARAKTPTPELDAQIRDFKTWAKAIYQDLKSAKAEAKVSAEPLIEANQQAERATVKLAVKTSGLWWCNSELVLNSFDNARIKAMREGSNLNFHRFDGSGRFAYRWAGGPESVSFGDLCSGKEKVKLTYTGSNKRGINHAKSFYALIMPIAAIERGVYKTLTFNLVLHRPLPAEARIKSFYISRARIGNDFRYKAHFVCNLPAVPVISKIGRTAGMDIGWRQLAIGLRVAMIHFNDGGTEEVIIPNRVLKQHEYLHRLQSELQVGINVLLSEIREKFDLNKTDEMDESIQKSLKSLKFAKTGSVPMLMRCVRALRASHPNLANTLNVWLYGGDGICRADRNREIHHLGDKLRTQRKHFYRNLAARLTRQCSIIGIEDMDLRRFATHNGPMEDAGKARYYRSLAALSELRLALDNAAKKNNCVIEKREDAYTTKECSNCGYINDVKRKLEFQCKGCGKVWDQDKNAAKNLAKSV
jgi:hypothetical protein